MAVIDFQLCTMSFHYQNCGDKLTHIFKEVGYTETFYRKLMQGKNTVVEESISKHAQMQVTLIRT